MLKKIVTLWLYNFDYTSTKKKLVKNRKLYESQALVVSFKNSVILKLFLLGFSENNI